MVIFLTIIGLSIVTVVGDYFIKLSGSKPGYFIDLNSFWLGLILYIFSAVGWFFVMKNVKLSTVGIVYGITTSILLVIIGIFYFKETLNAYELAGVGLGLISLILLTRFVS